MCILAKDNRHLSLFVAQVSRRRMFNHRDARGDPSAYLSN